VLSNAGFPPIVAQTLVEYSGLLGSVAARISAVIDRVEAYIGQGNVKYLLIGFLVLLLLLLVRRRRR
jgi:LPXTG-motif cell wall-anchored protein